MKNFAKNYQTEDLTVVWKPHLCIHSRVCCNGLPKVFNPNAKPWIKPENATTKELVKLIDKCPTQALSYKIKQPQPEIKNIKADDVIIQETVGGPLLVDGKFKLIDKNGNETSRDGMTALCRCGASQNKPFCDGSHNLINFDK